MKKKIGAIVMAGLMACTMTAGVAFAAGCGGSGFTEFEMPDGGFDTSKKVTIKFYHTMGQDLKAVLTQYIASFNELYPNITIEDEQVGGYEDVRDQIVTEISAGSGDHPNIAYCYPDHVALFNQSNAVMPLNAFLQDSEYNNMKVTRADGTEESLCFTKAQTDAFIKGYYDEGFQFDDGTKMYTLPFSKSTEVLYYNKTFFDAHNLTAPKTWEEMKNVCAEIKKIEPNSIPLGYDSESNWFITMCEQYGSPYTSADGNHFLFDNETNRGFVKEFYDWYQLGYFTTQELNKQYTSNLFKSQTSYMCIGSSAGAKNQSPGRTDGTYPFEIDITSIPQIHPENPKVISQGPSVCIFKHDDPQEVLASWLFVKYLTTNIGFQAQFSATSGYVPVIKTVTENETYKKNLDAADGFGNVTYLAAKVCMAQEAAYYTSPAFVGSARARDQVGYLMQAVFSSSKTIEQAFKDAIDECEFFAN